MVFGKIKPVATIVAQFAAGVEVECIQHEGKMFMPVIAGDFDTVDDGKKLRILLHLRNPHPNRLLKRKRLLTKKSIPKMN